MARKLRMEFAGGLYHVYSRGNEKRDIFFDDSDRKTFLRMLYDCKRRYEVQVLAYCLMTNHYHLFLHTPHPNLSVFMHRLLGVYAMKVNWKYDRVGHLFQGRYNSLIVDSETYLMRLSRYIHLNPTEAGVEPRPERYPWSSLAEYLNPNGRRIADPEMVLQRFASAEDYLKYVYEGIGKDKDLLDEVKDGVFLGSDEFVERMKELLGWDVDPDVAGRLKLIRRTIESILPAVAGSPQRIQILALCDWAGRPQQEVARLFGITQPAVCQSLRRTRARAERDPEFRQELASLKKRACATSERKEGQVVEESVIF